MSKTCTRTGQSCSNMPCLITNRCQKEDNPRRISWSDSTLDDNKTSVVSVPVTEIRSMYSGLGRAIESGDPLQIGLILGQVYKELEKYVNTSTAGDNRAPISFYQEGKGIQPVDNGGLGIAGGDKTGGVHPDSKEA